MDTRELEDSMEQDRRRLESYQMMKIDLENYHGQMNEQDYEREMGFLDHMIRSITEKIEGKEKQKDTSFDTKELPAILTPQYDITKVDPADFKRDYHQAAVKYQNDAEKLRKLNELNEQMKWLQKNKDDFLLDDQGFVTFFEGTFVPRPRNRKANETDHEYETFLENYYSTIYFNPLQLAMKKSESTQEQMEDKRNSVPQIEDKGKHVPQIEDKRNGISQIEDKGRKKEEKPKKTLDRILFDLTKGLELNHYADNRKYVASNIHPTAQFRKELSQGNYLYNIVGATKAVIRMGVGFAKKIISMPKSKKTKERIETLKSRVDTLTEEELKVIEQEFRLGRINEGNFPLSLLTMINERMQDRANQQVDQINQEIIKGYKEVFAAYQEFQRIEKDLKDPYLSKEEKQALKEKQEQLLKGKWEVIENIRKKQMEGRNILSSGAEGLSMDIKAARTKMNLQGKRFAKQHDWDVELAEKQADLSDQEQEAIAEKNSQKAMEAFVKREQLLSENTEIKNSIFGKRSVGNRYYTPLVERLDYRNDPFITDLITTIAVASAGVEVAASLKTHGKDVNATLEQHQQNIDTVNANNQKTMNQVHQAGADITSRRGTFEEGMKAQTNQDVVNVANTGERGSFDTQANVTGDWAFGDVYHQVDAKNHQIVEDMFQKTQSELNHITNQYGTGAINQEQAMQMISDVSDMAQGNLVNVMNQFLPELQAYAKNHQQFDLQGVQDAMQYVVNHPDAISNMNQAMVDVTNIGKTLSNLQIQEIAPLTELPNDMLTTMIGAATAGTLAYRVMSTMEKNERHGKYGNEITDLVENSIQEEQDMEEEKSK